MKDTWQFIAVLIGIILTILLFFVGMRFAFPAARAQEPNLDNADFIADAQFIRWTNYAVEKSADRGIDAVTSIEAAARRAGVEDYGKLVTTAWYEAKFKRDAVSSGGHRGMLQIAPCHKSAMAELKLDFYCEDDRLYFGMLLYKAHGLQPWSVRAKARRDYRKVMEAK